MPILTHRRIKHLARYFGVFAILCFASYKILNALFLLALLGPPLFLVYWLRTQGDVITRWIPNTPFFNDFFLFFPITILYFILVGFQLKNFLNERGLVRLFGLAALLAFLIYIHMVSFQEIALYWEGSTP